MKMMTIALALALAGCGASQADIAAQNAAQDDALCASIGIAQSDPRYAECRFRAAEMRMQEQAAAMARHQATSSALMGYGVGLMQQSQPRQVTPQTTNCGWLGNRWHCLSY